MESTKPRSDYKENILRKLHCNETKTIFLLNKSTSSIEKHTKNIYVICSFQ